MRPSTKILHVNVIYRNRDSSVSIVTGYGLDDRGSIPDSAINFSLCHRVQTGYGAHWAPYPMSTGGSFPWGEADNSPLSCAEVKNAWSYTFTHPYVFMAWCLVKYKCRMLTNISNRSWSSVQMTTLTAFYLSVRPPVSWVQNYVCIP
jgi:hypothetical protein